jgi:hypothetical protein
MSRPSWPSWIDRLNNIQVKVKVTLRLTVSQSVCLGVKPNLGLLTRDFFFFPQSYCLVFLRRSLWREVGSVICQFLWLQSAVVCQYIHTSFTLNIYIIYVRHSSVIIQYIQNIQVLDQFRLCTADYALVTSSLLYYGSLDTWTVVQMTCWTEQISDHRGHTV